MPRSPQIDHAGAWQHVMNRGIGRAPIFVDDIDRKIFLTELRDACHRHSAEVHAYCLMANHYHVLLHTPDSAMSITMQEVSSRFTQSINKRHRRDGPVFRGRFKSVLIKDDAQITHVTRYIHLNPVDAMLVQKAEAWRWSSASAYMGHHHETDWVRTDFILSMFGTYDRMGTYRKFLETPGR